MMLAGTAEPQLLLFFGLEVAGALLGAAALPAMLAARAAGASEHAGW